MKPINIINNLEQELNITLTKINEMHEHSEEPNKSQLFKIMQDHIAYNIFLKELKINIENKTEIEKDFFKTQILNIYQSCAIIKEMHSSYLKGEI